MLKAGKKLREGVTTGASAAAAAKAAALVHKGEPCPRQVTVEGPTGLRFTLETFPVPGGGFGVIKDAGDDIDATDGMTVCVSIEVSDEPGPVTFAAGPGVGTVTLPGMKVPPGEAAINPVPRRMIEQVLREVLGDRAVKVTVSIPGGEEVAKRTFNPRLGIRGGLSVLGTTGVVRPMDESSILESLTLELDIMKSLGVEDLVITFGNTGEGVLRRVWDIKGRCVIQTGNYPGWVLDEAARLKFRRGLFCAHPGKLLKVAAGSFRTHNREADGRLEALCTQAALAGVQRDVIARLYGARTTENAMDILKEEKLEFLWTALAGVAAKRCFDRSFGDFPVEVAFIDNLGNLLGATPGCEDFRGLRAGLEEGVR